MHRSFFVEKAGSLVFFKQGEITEDTWPFSPCVRTCGECILRHSVDDIGCKIRDPFLVKKGDGSLLGVAVVRTDALTKITAPCCFVMTDIILTLSWIVWRICFGICEDVQAFLLRDLGKTAADPIGVLLDRTCTLTRPAVLTCTDLGSGGIIAIGK